MTAQRRAVPALLAAASACLAQPPDPDALAAHIVETSARVAEGETVLIRGHVRDQELLEDIALHCRAMGAFPILSYASDHLSRGLLDQVPERFDNQLSGLDIKLAPSLAAVITIDPTDNPSLLNHIPSGRLAARAKADQAFSDLLRRMRVRQVFVGNGLYPTAAAANQYTLSVNELSKVYYSALDADPDGLEAAGEMVRLVLSSGKDVHITNPNGTDLKLSIEGRPTRISDGTLPDPATMKDLPRPLPPLIVCLPAGEAMIVPVLTSAEGKVVVDTLAYRGREVTGLTVTFKAGKVTNMYAKSGIDALRPLYDAAPPGKEQLAYLDFGLNPQVQLPAGVKPLAPMPIGMVSICIGNNIRAGGESTVPFEVLLPLPGSTVTIDQATLVDGGTLILPTSPTTGEPSEPTPESAPADSHTDH